MQPKKLARSLTFWISEEEELYYSCSENKGADQLRSYCEADQRLCFRIGKNPFSHDVAHNAPVFPLFSVVQAESELQRLQIDENKITAGKQLALFALCFLHECITIDCRNARRKPLCKHEKTRPVSQIFLGHVLEIGVKIDTSNKFC